MIYMPYLHAVIMSAAPTVLCCLSQCIISPQDVAMTTHCKTIVIVYNVCECFSTSAIS